MPLALGAAAAAVLAVALVVPQSDDRSEERRTPDSSVAPSIVTVAKVLRQAADVSGGQPDRSGVRIWKTEAVQQKGTAPPENRTAWYGRNVDGVLIDDFGRATLPAGTFWMQQTSLTWDELLALPTDPIVLHKLLERDAGNLVDRDWFVVKTAAYFLAETPAPPALRKALWEVIAGVPGVESRGVVKDALGRDGVGLVLEAPDRGRVELVLDPEGGALLQSTTQSAKANSEPFRTTYLSQGPATSIP